MTLRQEKGRAGEDAAADWLEKAGMRILARNWRNGSYELDLVCRDGDELVFVEVRLRRSSGFGGAAASITLGKQRRLTLAAEHYLQKQGWQHCACRFDCVLLDGQTIEWVRDAFSAV